MPDDLKLGENQPTSASIRHHTRGKREHDGVEWHRVYDEDWREVHYSDSTGYGRQTTYDHAGREISYRDSTGMQRSCQYDSRGNEISYIDSTGYWRISSYNMQNRMTYRKESTGRVTEVSFADDGITETDFKQYKVDY